MYMYIYTLTLSIDCWIICEFCCSVSFLNETILICCQTSRMKKLLVYSLNGGSEIRIKVFHNNNNNTHSLIH